MTDDDPLSAFRLADSFLPIGSYAVSYGLEQFVQSGRVETPAELEALETVAQGFMRRKVMAASEALEGGAAEVVVADANAEAPIVAALDGAGTHLLPGAVG